MHRLEFGGTYNTRDLGGLPLGPGGEIARGLLFRSDRPRPGPETVAAAGVLGLRTVVDLRDPDERERRPATIDAATVRTVHRSLPMNGLIVAHPQLRVSLAALYSEAVRRLGHQIAAAIDVLCAPNALPALVHCAAGKDRTGLVVATLLSALGVSDADIAADYALTAGFLQQGYFAEIDRQESSAFPPGIDLAALRGSPPEAILAALQTLRTIAGDARGYLVAHGADPVALNRVRTAVTV